MEAKSVILGVLLILSLVVTSQIKAEAEELGNTVQVEAKWLCCPYKLTRRCANKHSRGACEKTPGCHFITVQDRWCPPVGNSGTITEYCKLGCVFSVCNAISTHLKISGEKVVNEAVGQCNNACSAFCTKGSTLEIA